MLMRMATPCASAPAAAWLLVAGFWLAGAAPAPVLGQAGPGPGVEEAFEAIAAASGGAHPTRVRLLTDNAEAWYARWNLVAAARETIDFTTYEAADDAFMASFIGLLIRKAKQGVRIRLMLDFRGARELLRARLGQQYLRDLVAAGAVDVRVFNPPFRSLPGIVSDPLATIACNHQKLVNNSMEYRIRVRPDGSMEVLCGPEHVASPERLRSLAWLTWLYLLRPLI
jgi:hypothetical protein